MSRSRPLPTCTIPSRRPAPPRGDAGSAYLAVLLVLLVLTTIAVALVVVTATEMRIGANERTVQRTLAAAEAGVGIAVARMLVAADYSEGGWDLRSSAGEDAGAPPRVGTRVELAPLVPLVEAPCSLCQINDAGTYGATTFSRANVATTSRGRRAAGAVGLGERTVSAILDLQPVQVPTSAYHPLAELEPAELAEKIRF
jgi:hypothetical protein